MRSKCWLGVLGSAIAGAVAAGAFAAGLLDQLDTFSNASSGFQVWWVAGGCVLGLLGGVFFGMATFCLGKD